MISAVYTPADVQVGQRAKFVCPIDDCTFYFWHTWLPTDSSGSGFGDSHCYLHGVERPVMVIVEVEAIERGR